MPHAADMPGAHPAGFSDNLVIKISLPVPFRLIKFYGTMDNGSSSCAVSWDSAGGCRGLQKPCEGLRFPATLQLGEPRLQRERTCSSSHSCRVAEQGRDKVCWTANPTSSTLSQGIDNDNHHEIDLFIGSRILKARLLLNGQRG